MTVVPDLFRCLTYILLHLLLFFFAPVWNFLLVTTKLDSFAIWSLVAFTVVATVFFVPVAAAFMTAVFQFTIDDKKLTWDVLTGMFHREIGFDDIKVVRYHLFAYHASRGFWSQGIPLPALFLLNKDVRRALRGHLRKVLPDGHPLMRLAG